MSLLGLHHVQLAIPYGAEDRARAFYGDLLGLTVVPKPQELAGRGGLWFETGTLRLHLGIETPFNPARKAHPAFTVQDLIALRTRLAAAEVEVTEISALPGLTRFYASDPFRNRLEFIQPG
ncbi:VOC family protein [Aestuariibius insulae]|uniref:VOC family protein n=1 Tax=Aestuariibius insulae TaxID=2058287 RepID=UPI00345EAC09